MGSEGVKGGESGGLGAYQRPVQFMPVGLEIFLRGYGCVVIAHQPQIRQRKQNGDLKHILVQFAPAYLDIVELPLERLSCLGPAA